MKNVEQVIANDNSAHNQTNSDFAKLPHDIILDTFSYLNKKDLARVAQSSNYLRNFTKHPIFQNAPMPDRDYRKTLSGPKLFMMIRSDDPKEISISKDEERSFYKITSLLQVDKDHLIYGTSGGFLRLWNIKNKKWVEIFPLEIYSSSGQRLSPITALCLVSDRYLVASSRFCLELVIVDIDKWKILKTLNGHKKVPDNSPSLSMATVMKGYEDAFDETTDKEKTSFKNECMTDCGVIAIVSLDKSRIVSATNQEIFIWDINTGKCLTKCENKEQDYIADSYHMLAGLNLFIKGFLFTFKDDEKDYIVSICNRKLYLWDANIGKSIKVFSLKNYGERIKDVAFISNNSFACLFSDQTLRIFHLGMQKCIKCFEDMPGEFIAPLSKYYLLIANGVSGLSQSYILDIRASKVVFIEYSYRLKDPSDVFQPMYFLKLFDGNIVGYNSYSISVWSFPELTLEKQLKSKNDESETRWLEYDVFQEYRKVADEEHLKQRFSRVRKPQ